jgi:hypothetical protein
MESLIEKLYNNNVIFSYYGFVDESVLGQVLRITRSKLETSNESRLVINRVTDVLNDCVESIIQHNFYPDDDRLHYKSLLVVSRQQFDYEVDTLNVVNTQQKARITEQLNFLASKTRDQLRNLRVQCQLENSTIPVNEEIVALLLRADHYDCAFKPNDENFLFNISLRINTVSEPVLS